MEATKKNEIDGLMMIYIYISIKDGDFPTSDVKLPVGNNHIIISR